MYDPFTDDARLAVNKMELCALSGSLVLAGSAGQIVVLQFERDARKLDVPVTAVSIVSNQAGFTWRGHNPLEAKTSDVQMDPGFQPVCIVQIHPPISCTTLAVHPEWQL